MKTTKKAIEQISEFHSDVSVQNLDNPVGLCNFVDVEEQFCLLSAMVCLVLKGVDKLIVNVFTEKY